MHLAHADTGGRGGVFVTRHGVLPLIPTPVVPSNATPVLPRSDGAVRCGRTLFVKETRPCLRQSPFPSARLCCGAGSKVNASRSWPSTSTFAHAPFATSFGA